MSVLKHKLKRLSFIELQEVFNEECDRILTLLGKAYPLSVESKEMLISHLREIFEELESRSHTSSVDSLN